MKIRNSPQPEPPMQASKWLSIPVLIDREEMESLFEALGSFYIYEVSQVQSEGKEIMPAKDFLQVYEKYIQALKQGEIPAETLYRAVFSSIFTASTDPLYALQLPNGKHLIRVSKPVIQLQPNSIDYSPHDGKFRSGVFSLHSVLWGIQFSYPQLYLDPISKQPFKVVENEEFPNTRLFHILQRWIREHTIPTPFLVEGKIVNVPIRLGKKCLEWIRHHPQLAKKNLQIR